MPFLPLNVNNSSWFSPASTADQITEEKRKSESSYNKTPKYPSFLKGID